MIFYKFDHLTCLLLKMPNKNHTLLNLKQYFYILDELLWNCNILVDLHLLLLFVRLSFLLCFCYLVDLFILMVCFVFHFLVIHKTNLLLGFLYSKYFKTNFCFIRNLFLNYLKTFLFFQLLFFSLDFCFYLLLESILLLFL